MSQDNNSYRIVRLVNGEKLIAKITGSNKNKLFLERPMVIEGIVGTESINQMMVVKKEYLVLQNWIEFCKNNIVGIPKNHILTIYTPDDLLTMAYNTQKEREDTAGGSDIVSLLPDTGEYNKPYSDISNIINDIINSNIDDFNFTTNDIEEEENEEDWDESSIDKNRNDYGNQIDDWSPYIEDYLNGNDDSSNNPIN